MSVTELFVVIKQIQIKAMGLDGLTIDMVRHFSPHILPLIRYSYCERMYPFITFSRLMKSCCL